MSGADLSISSARLALAAFAAQPVLRRSWGLPSARGPREDVSALPLHRAAKRARAHPVHAPRRRAALVVLSVLRAHGDDKGAAPRRTPRVAESRPGATLSRVAGAAIRAPTGPSAATGGNAAKGAGPPPGTNATAHTRRQHSEETKAKIAASALGRQHDASVRKKISQKMKGRVPWNKGKKMSAETRARMSESRQGVAPWNKGMDLAEAHRNRIAAAMSGRTVSSDTKLRMAFARRRPFDSIIAPGARAPSAPDQGDYPLVETEDIHEFVALRRHLRQWSDDFNRIQGRRPSMADIRRLTPIETIRKFERYVDMRNRLRGLASDVVAGSVDPNSVPAPAPGRSAIGKKPKFLQVAEARSSRRSSGFLTIGDADETTEKAESGYALSKEDYRLIGTYRVMETRDIHRFVRLRREIRVWTDKFRAKHNRTPAMSDIEKHGAPFLYSQCVEYLKMRQEMVGLVTEVYGDSMTGLDRLEELTTRGQAALEILRDQPADQ